MAQPQIRLDRIQKTFTVYKRPKQEGKGFRFSNPLARERGEVQALRDISFSISQGELVGYIGPNGAGKSTTVKVMSGILTPEKGDCRILGCVPWKEREEYVGNIGVVFGQRSQLWWDVPVRDSFSLLRDIYNLPAGRYRERLSSLSQALELENLLDTPVRQLSLGQRMRCEVAAALLHSPKILFLDEPTIGLDAVSKLSLRRFLREENRQNGVTMVLTTHDMDDIEALCTRVMTIGRGQLLYDGSLAQLKRRYAPLHRVRARVERAVQPLPEIPGITGLTMEGETVTGYFDPEETAASRMVAALSAALPLRDIVIEEQDIDEMIAAMYREMKL